jgi:hypothetical protein
MKNEECCPRFDPKPWDGKVLEWKSKRFIKDKVRTFFYIPLGFGRVITRLMKKAEKARAKVPDNLCLSEHPSKFRMDLYLAVDRNIPGAQNLTMGGKFLAKVYEGSYKDMGAWHQDFAAYAKKMKVTVEKTYLWYTTCPKCAKKHGKNYVVFLGKIS